MVVPRPAQGAEVRPAEKSRPGHAPSREPRPPLRALPAERSGLPRRAQSANRELRPQASPAQAEAQARPVGSMCSSPPTSRGFPQHLKALRLGRPYRLLGAPTAVWAPALQAMIWKQGFPTNRLLLRPLRPPLVCPSPPKWPAGQAPAALRCPSAPTEWPAWTPFLEGKQREMVQVERSHETRPPSTSALPGHISPEEAPASRGLPLPARRSA